MSDQRKALESYFSTSTSSAEPLEIIVPYQSEPDLETVTDFENSSEVQEDYSVVMDALARNKTVTSGLLDTAAYSDDGPAEFLRDITVRIGTKVNLATEAEDWTNAEKIAFNRMQKNWEKVSVTGMGEWATTIKDYGIDAVANLETLPAIASLIFQGGTGAAAAQVGSRAALSKTLAKVAAAAQPTTKTGFATYGAAFGGADDVALQNLELGTGAREEYSRGQTLGATAVGAVAGAGIKKGMELFQGRNASKVAREAARKDLEVSDNSKVPESEGVNVFEEGIARGTIPTSANDIMVDLEKLIEDNKLTPDVLVTMLGDVKNPIVFKRDQLVKEIGGGAQTTEEINNILLQAVESGATGEQIKNKLAHGMWKTATSLTGKVYGKAPGILTPYTKFSNSAKSLQGLLNYQFNIGIKTTEKVVGMDFSEVATRITGDLNNKFMAALEPIAMHALTGEVEDSVNTALNLAVRGQASGNAKIDLAAKQIQNNLKKIGRQLKKEGLIKHEVKDYIPRMWDRKAVEENQDELVQLLLKEGEADNEIQAISIVEGMLDKKNQLSSGTTGHFFSSTRVFENIKDEASLAKFLNQDIRATMLSYNFQAGKSLAKKKVLGVIDEKEFINKWVNKIDSEMGQAGQALSKEEKLDMVDLYRVATGENLDRYGQAAQNAADAYQLTTRVALLGFATVSSLTEIMINLSKAGFRNTIKGFSEASEQSFKNVTKDLHSDLQSRHGLTANEAHRELQSVGVAMDQSMSQLGNRIAGDDLINEKMQQANNKFFRITMLDQWTKYVQRTSFAAGKNFIQENIEQIAKHGNLPKTRKQSTLMGELNELGIDSDQAVSWFNNGAKRDDEFYQNIINGAGRYTNQVILNPTAMSGLKPLLHSKPTTSILFGLMGYPAAFTNTVLKGAIQKSVQDPVRNLAKIGVTGLLMTETARMTNWIRSRGENEKDKSTIEIYLEAMARWGAFGIGADQLLRAQKTAQYTGKPGAALATAPFGPVVGDAANLVLRGPAQMLGSKVPGSSMGNAVLGKESMQEFRKLTREMDQKLLEAITGDKKFESKMFNIGGEVNVPNAPAEPDERINKITGQPYNYEAGAAFMDSDDPLKTQRSGFVIGGVVKGATKVLSKLGQVIDSRTDSMFKPEVIENVAEQIEYLKVKDTMFDDPDMPVMYDDYAQEEFGTYIDSAVSSQLREKVARPLDDDLLDEFNTIGGEDFSIERGYTPEEIEEFEFTNILSDEYDMDGSVNLQINEILNDLKENYTRVKGENLKPIEENEVPGMKKLVDYMAAIIKDEPVGDEMTAEGIRKAARFQISKLLNDDEDLSSIQELIDDLPGISTVKTPDEIVSVDKRAANFEVFLKDSKEVDLVYRATSSFGNTDAEIAFTFPRELGVHIGSSGQAHFIAAKALDGQRAVDQFSVPALQGEDLTRREVDDFFASQVKREGAQKPVSITRGYISVKNPLVLEEDMGTWAMDDLLLNERNRNSLINAMEEQGTLKPSALKELNLLQREAEFLIDFKTDIESMQYTYIDGVEEAVKKGTKYSAELSEVYTGLTNTFKYEIESARLTKKVQSWIKNQGFDSVKYRNTVEASFEGESDYSYILFDPQQFKTVESSFDVKDRRQTYAEGGAVNSHQIEAGETLSGIANKYGTTVESLVALNDIEDANRIYAKDVLTLRPSTGPTTLDPERASLFKETAKTVQDTRADIGAQVDAAMADVSSSAVKTADAVLSAVEDTTATVSEGLETAQQSVSDASSAISEGAGDFIEEATTSIKSTVSEGVEAAREVGADLGATVAEGAEAASSYFGDVAEAGAETVTEVVEKVGSTLSTLKRILGADFSSTGRTAENTANTTEVPELNMPAIEFKPRDVEITSEAELADQESLVDTLKGLYNASGTQVAKNLIAFFNPLAGDKTEDDYNPQVIEALGFAAANALKKGKGTIDYGDYNLQESNVRAQVASSKQRTRDKLEARMKTGNITPTEEAAFSVGGGGVIVEGDKVYVTDKYDFSKLETQITSILPDEYAKLRNWISNYEGNEFKSKIFVGTLKDLGL
jgi:LysM repeat protein